jgi:hypothetical protein
MDFILEDNDNDNDDDEQMHYILEEIIELGHLIGTTMELNIDFTAGTLRLDSFDNQQLPFL